MRSEADKVYLANKHKGGMANAKGGLYEDCYAVFQIVSCIAKYKAELEGVALQTQLEDTFVDDLLIAHPDKNVYHQLKNTRSLTWNTKSSDRTVASDFENQIKDCQERKEAFALKLVYSAVNSNVGESIPDSIQEYTTAEYFPYERAMGTGQWHDKPSLMLFHFRNMEKHGDGFFASKAAEPSACFIND